MANEITIVVKSRGGASVAAEMRKSGKDGGDGFADELTKSMERGLAGAEGKLASARARMEKAIALGGSEKQRASIEYDIKLHEASVAKFRADIDHHSRSSGDTLEKGMSGGFMGALSKLANLGMKAGTELGSTLAKGASGFGSMLQSHPIIATAVVIGVLMTPIIAAALSAAVLLGLGGGVLAAGIAAAAGSPMVKSAFGRLSDEASAVFHDFGRPFIGPLAKAIDTVTSGVSRMSASFGRMGQAVAPVIGKIADGLVAMGEEAMPGIEMAVRAAVPLLEKLAEHLPRIGAAMSDFFRSIAEGSDGAIKFLDYFLSWLETTLVMTGRALGWLSRLFDLVTGGSGKVKEFGKAQEELGNSSERAAKAAKRHADALQAVFDKLVSLGKINLSVRDAERQYQAALDDSTQALKDNGKTLDVNTAKGRGNSAALDKIADSTFSLIGSQKQAHASQDRLTGTLQRGADAAFNTARKMGMTTQAAIDYTRSIYGIPPSRSTLINALNAAKSAKEVRDLKNELNALRDRDILVTYTEKRYVQDYGREAAGGRRGGFAHGGIVGAAAGGLRSNLVEVGEHGRELLELPPGTRVHPNGATERILAEMSQGGGGGPHSIFYVTIHSGADPNDVYRALASYAQINNGVRLRGGVKTL